jgi:hypothetical protein
MSDEEKIAIAGNVFAPAILALRSQGFAVNRKELDDREMWSAYRDGLDLIADDPVQLLGLASMRAERGPDWKTSDEELTSILDEFGLSG